MKYDSRIHRWRGRIVAILILMLTGITGAIAQTISFTSQPSTTIGVNTAYLYNANALSSDGNQVQYTLSFGPTGMQVDQNSGVVSWNPSTVESVEAEIRAELAGDPSVNITQRWTINVLTLNEHPGCTGTDMWVNVGDGVNGWGKAAVSDGNDLYLLRNRDATWTGGSVLSKWNGSYWTDLMSYDRTDSIGNVMAVYNGDIYIGGQMSDLVGFPGTAGVMRWDGTTLNGVGSHSLSGVTDMEVFNNALYVIGYGYNGSWSSLLMKWDGSNWTELASGEYGVLRNLAVSNGKLYLGGLFTNFGVASDANYLAEIDNDQVVAVNNEPDGAVYQIVSHLDGLALVQEHNSKRETEVSYWTPTSLTTLPGIPFTSTISGSLISYNGELYSASMAIPRPNFRYVVWRYDGTDWIPVSSLEEAAGVGQFGLVEHDGQLFSYGDFSMSCGAPVANVARLCNEAVCGRITGVVYRDADRNCARDNGEVGVAQNLIEFQPGSYFASTDDQGIYNVYLPVGSYSADLVLKRHWMVPCSGTQSISIPNAGAVLEDIDFGTDMIPGISDVSVSVTSSIARPGREMTYTILYQNIGTVAATGKVLFDAASALTYLGSTENPDRQNGNHFEWDFTNLPVGESVSITLTFRVSQNAQINDEICVASDVELDKGGDIDRTLSDNRDSSCTTVRASYDPNDIEVTPTNYDIELNPEPLGPNDTILTYRVRFQNTGNDTAFRVIVRDTINPDLLDLRYLILGAASHGYKFDVTAQGVLTWTFDNIMLPDSNANEVGSHGYFKFRIGLKKDLLPFTSIPNNVSIYFDYNDPVKTNTVVSVTGGVSSVANEEKAEKSLSIYPNPTRGTSLISLRLDHASNVELRLIDTKGSVVRDLLSSRLEAGEHRVELKTGNMPAGLYFVTVIRDGEKEVYPVVVAE